MKKVLFVSAILLAVSTSSFAQKDKEETKKLAFSIGVEGALPMGTFGDGWGFGFGGSAQGDYNVSDKFAVTLNAGYLSFSGKSTSYTVLGQTFTFKNSNLGMIPVLVGGKFAFSSNVYGSAQVGLSFFSGGGTGSNFTYAPGVGVKFSQFDVMLKYTGISASNGGSSLGMVGLRAAYTF